jgi:hypothetical protein
LSRRRIERTGGEALARARLIRPWPHEQGLEAWMDVRGVAASGTDQVGSATPGSIRESRVWSWR